MDSLGHDELMYLLSNHLRTHPLAVVALSRVCRSLRDAAADDKLWQQLLAVSFGDALSVIRPAVVSITSKPRLST